MWKRNNIPEAKALDKKHTSGVFMSEPDGGRMHPDGILQELARGEPGAFEKLYDQYSGRIYFYCLAQLRSQQDAEDVMQEVMLRLVRSRDKFVKVKNLAAYVFTTARNEIRRYVSKHRSHPTVSDDEVVLVVPTPEAEDADLSGLAKAVNAAIRELPPEQSEIVSLKHWVGLTFAEIAEVLGISSNTAASRYRYALEKIRSLVEKKNEQDTRREVEQLQAR
jgi:RNA polymerase sigma-70 factor, ECF subfamily